MPFASAYQFINSNKLRLRKWKSTCFILNAVSHVNMTEINKCSYLLNELHEYVILYSTGDNNSLS